MNAGLRDFFTRRSPGTGKAILGLWLACWLTPAFASGLPQGGTISHGQGSISTPSATQMQIDQFSQRMAADFQSFDIARDHGVNISQPGVESLFVGRITGESATQIFGTLTADGQVMLLNPRGVVFGEGSRVDTASLMASTLNVDIDRVMDGVLELEFSADIAGKIINRGTLTAATGGSVTLLGDEVINEGLIVADMGRVNLASGSKAFVTFDAERLIGVRVTEGALGGTGGDAAVANLGEIQADGGQILLTAKAARDLFSMAVNNEGVLRANQAQEVDGEIRLFASEGDTFTSGTIEAAAGSGRGGNIEVLGERVAVTGGRIDASGTTGGGDIKIGGAFQGKGDTPTASHTYVGPTAQIAADATVAGDGGEVIVWADNTTRFHGEISARGGPEGGDGGFVEVSGKEHLVYRGTADVRAPAGEAGVVLLDPDHIVIANGLLDTGDDAELGDGEILFVDGDGTFTITNAKVEEQLGLGSVRLQAEIDITQNADAAIDVSADADAENHSLTLQAGNDIALLGGISLNDGALIVSANDPANAAPSGTGSITIDGPIITGSGGIDLDLNGSTGTVALTANVSGGSLNVSGTTALAADVTTTGTQDYTGLVTLSGDAPRTLTGTTITLRGGAGGANDLADALEIQGALVLDDKITSLASLDVAGVSTLGATVTTTENQVYGGQVTVGTGTSGMVPPPRLVLSGNVITLTGGATGNAGTAGLETLSVEGALVLNGAITNLLSLNVTGTTALSADVTTSGRQAYTGQVTLSGDAPRTLTGTRITLDGGASGANDLADALDIQGDLVVNEAITNLLSLNVTGTTALSADVATHGAQSYAAAVLRADVALHTASGAGDITFSGPLLSMAHAGHGLGIDAGAGNITFGGALGDDATQALGFLTITHAGDVTFADGVELAVINGSSGVLTQTEGTGTTTFNGAVTANSLDLNTFSIVSAAAGSIRVTGGNVTLTAERNIGLAAAVDATASAGNIELDANVGGGSTGNFAGILITGAPLVTAGAGAISLHGTGGDTGLANRGIRLSGATLSTVDGDITLIGQGGSGAGNAHTGVAMAASTVTTDTGAIAMTGFGGMDGTDATSAHHGIALTSGSRVQAGTSVGGIALTGIGGNALGLGAAVDASHGILLVGSDVTLTDGPLSLVGRATANSPPTSESHGIVMFDANVLATVAGAIDLTAEALNAAGFITNSTDFGLGGQTTIGADGNADPVTLNIGNAGSVDSFVLLGTTRIRGDGDLLIQPLHDLTSIGLGNGALGNLRLNQEEIGAISSAFDRVTIGRAAGGQVDITSASFVNPLVIRSGGAITVKGTLSVTDSIDLLSFNALTLAGNVRSSGGAITIGDGALYAGNLIVDGAASFDTTFDGAVAGANLHVFGTTSGTTATNDVLTIRAGTAGMVDLDGLVGHGTATLNGLNIVSASIANLPALRVDGGNLSVTANAINLGASTYHAVSAGNISFNGAVVLGQAATAVTADAGAVLFGGVVDGASALTVMGDSATFAAPVGGAIALSSLAVTGATNLNGGTVATDGNQTFISPVRLGADTVLSSGGDVALAAVDGAFRLEIAAHGNAFLDGAVGGTTHLTEVLIGATTAQLDDGVDVVTADTDGNITFNVDALNLAGNNAIDAGAGTFQIFPRTKTSTIEFAPTFSGDGAVDVFYDSAFSAVKAGQFVVGDASHVGDIRVGHVTAAVTAPYDLQLVNSGTAAIVFQNDYLAGAGGFDLTLTSGTGGIELGSLAAASLTIDLEGGAFAANAAVLLTTDTMIDAGTISFNDRVDGAFGLTLDTNPGDIVFAAEVGDDTPLEAILIVSANAVTANGIRARSFSQLGGTGLTTLNGGAFTDGTTEALNVTGLVNVTNAAMTLNHALTAGTTVDLNASAGLLTIAAAADIVSVDAVTLTGSGGIETGGDVTTSAANVTFASATTVTDAVAIDTGAGGGSIAFADTLNGGFDLSLTAGAGDITLAGRVGEVARLGALQLNSDATTALLADVQVASLVTDATGSTELHGNVDATGTQTYGDAVLLAGAAAIRTLTGTAVTFGATVDALAAGAQGLLVSGNAAFNDVVGATALASLEVSGTTQTAATAITTTGTQIFTGAVTVGDDIVFGGNGITFNDALLTDGTARNLTLNAGASGAVFNNMAGTVGAAGQRFGAITVNSFGTDAFKGDVFAASVMTDADGSTEIHGNVDTIGSQSYADAVLLAGSAGPRALAGTAVTFGATVDALAAGAQGLLVSGNAAFNDAVGATALASLEVSGTTQTAATAITTTGTQIFIGAVTVGDDIVFGGNGITFNDALLTDGTARNLTLNAGASGAVFNDAAGTATDRFGAIAVNSTGTDAFKGDVFAASVTTDADGSTEIHANVNTSGTQSYGDAVVLAGLDGLRALTGTTVAFGAAVDALAAGNQGLLLTGNAAFNDVVGGAEALASLEVTGATSIRPGATAITTTGTQTFTGALTLNDSLAVTTMDSDIVFAHTVNGGHDLTLAAGTATITTHGVIGGGTPLSAFLVDSATIVNLNRAITVDGGRIQIGSAGSRIGEINVNGVLTTLGGASGTLVINGGGINLNASPVVGATNIELFGAGADIEITADISVTNALEISAPRDIIVRALVETTGAAADLTIMADVDGSGDGGLVVDTAGRIDAGQNLLLAGSSFTNLGGAGALGALTANAVVVVDGGGTEVQAGRDLTISANAAAPLTADVVIDGALAARGTGSIRLDAANEILLGANITNTGGDVVFEAATALTDAVAIGTAGGDIRFASVLEGGFDLNLTAGAGNILLTGAVGGAHRLGALEIVSAQDFTANALTLARLTQTAGGGVTSLNGDIDAVGPVTLMASGGISLAGNVTTHDANITFASATALTDAVVLDTGAGAGSISFAASLDGSFDLSLAAGTGDIDFTGLLGDTAGLGAIQIASARNVTANGIRAGSLAQLVGTGVTTLNGGAFTNGTTEALNVTGLVNVTNEVIALNHALTAGGTVDLNASVGLLTIAANGDIVADDGASLIGAVGIQTAGDVTTIDTDITFASATVLTGSVLLGSGAGAGDIVFGNTLDGGFDLTLTAGMGDITLTGAIGGGARLGALEVVSAQDFTANALTAASLTQTTGTGITTLNAAVDTDAALGVNLAGMHLALNAPITATGGGVVFDLMGTAAIVAAGNISAVDAVSLTAVGGISTAGGIDTTDADITFASATRLTGNVLLDSAAGAGDIVFADTLEGAFDLGLTAGTGNIDFAALVGSTTPLGAVTVNAVTNLSVGAGFTAESLEQLVAGSGITTIDGMLTAAAGSVTLDALALDLNAGIRTFGEQVTLRAGTGGLTLAPGQNVMTTAAVDSGLASGSIDIDVGGTGTVDLSGGLVSAGATNATGIGSTGGAVTIATLDGDIGVGNIHTDGGAATAIGFDGGAAGLISVHTGNANQLRLNASTLSAAGGLGDGGGLQGPGANIRFGEPVLLALGAATISTGATSGNISFVDTLDGGFGLTLTAGAGDITFTGEVGALERLGALEIVAARDVTANTLTLAGLTQLAGTGTTTLNGEVDTNGAAGVNLTGVVLALNAPIRAAGGGVTFDLTGTATIAAIGDITADEAVSVTAAGGIATAGDITTASADVMFASATALTDAVTIATGSGAGRIVFAEALDGAFDLSLTAGSGDLTFVEAVGAIDRLGALSFDSSGTTAFLANVSAGSLETTAAGVTAIHADVDSTGVQVYGNAAELRGGVGVQTLTGSLVRFAATLDAATAGAEGLAVSTVEFGGVVGGSAALGSLNVTGTTTTLAGGTAITTTGTQIYTGALTLNDTLALTTTAADILLSNTIDGAHDLTLAAGNGTISTDGVIGGGTPLSAFLVDSANRVILNEAITVDGSLIRIGSAGSRIGAIDVDGVLTTLGGASGTLVINGGGINLNASPVVGGTNIELFGAGNDIEITADISVVNALKISAPRDIIVRALVQTTDAAADLRIMADVDGSGLGGLVVDTVGRVDAGQDLFLSGSSFTNLGADPLGTDVAVNIEAGAGMRVQAGRDLTLTANAAAPGAANVIIDGALAGRGTGTIRLDAANAVLLGADLANVGGDLVFGAAAVLRDAVSIRTAGGDIRFTDVLDGGFDLTLTAAAGDIVFTGAVGATDRLGALEILSANDVRANALSLASLAQMVGSGTTSLNGAVDTHAAAGVSLTGSNLTVSAPITTMNGGVAVNLAGTASILAAGRITSDGPVSLSAAGGISTAADITTSDDTISFASATSLSGAVAFTTGAALGGNIHFQDTLDGPGALTLTSGSGDVRFDEAVGASTPLAAITLNQVNEMIAAADFSVGRLDQIVTGDGVSRFGGLLTATVGTITLDARELDFVGGIRSFGRAIALNAGDGGLTLAAGQAITTTAALDSGQTSGRIDIAVGGSGRVSLAGDLITTGADNATGSGSGGADVLINTAGGAVSMANAMTDGGDALAGNSAGGAAGSIEVTTSGGVIRLEASSVSTSGGAGAGTGARGAGSTITFNDAVGLAAGPVSMTTGPTAGDIVFLDAVSGAQNLNLTAGSGSIEFTGSVGDPAALADLRIVSAQNVLFEAAVAATNLVQEAGTGTTIFEGRLNLADSLAFTGGNLTLNDGFVAGGGATVSNAGLFTLAVDGFVSAEGGFTQNGAGGSRLGGDVTTDGNDISLSGAVILTEGVALSTGALGGDIVFGGSVDSDGATPRDLSLLAGSGNIDLVGAAGTRNRLGTLDLVSAHDVTAAAITATHLLQQAGEGTTTLNGVIDISTADGVSLNGTHLALNASITVGGGGSVTFDHSGTAIIAAASDIVADGAVAISAAGGISTAGDVATAGGTIDFNSATTLTGNVVLASAGGAITLAPTASEGFGLSLDGGAAGNVGLASFAGGGNLIVVDGDVVSFNGPVSAGAVTLQSASSGFTFFDTLDAASIVAAAGAFDIAFRGATATVSGTTTLANTGTNVFGDDGDLLSFQGGLTATAGNASIHAAVSTSGNVLGLGAVTLTGRSSLGSAGGAINLGAVNAAGFDLSFDSGTGALNLNALTRGGSIDFLDAGDAVVGALEAADVRIAAGGPYRFTAVVDAANLFAIGGGSRVTFDAALQAGVMTAAATATEIRFNDFVEISGSTVLDNTGGNVFGTAADVQRFLGGLTATGSTAMVGGAIASAGAAINLADVTLSGSSSFNATADGAAGGAALVLGAVTGQASDLALNAGTGGVVSVGSLNGSGNLRLMNADTATFAGSVTIGAVDIEAATTGVTFTGDLSAASLTAAAGGYRVAFRGENTVVSGATVLANTGLNVFGDSSDTLQFAGGLEASAGGAQLDGVLSTAATPLNLAAITLTGDSTLATAGGALSVGAVAGGGFDLGFDSGVGSLNLAAIANVAAVTFSDAGAATVAGPLDSTTLTIDGGETYVFGAGVTAATRMTLNAFGSVTFSDSLETAAFISNAADSTLVFGGDVTVGNSLSINDGNSVAFNSALTAGSVNAAATATRLAFNSTVSVAGATTLNTTAEVVFGSSGELQVFAGGLTVTAAPITGFATLRTQGAPINLGDVTQAGAIVLDTTAAGNASGADVALGSVVGAGMDLTVSAGSGSAVTLAELTGGNTVAFNSAGSVSVGGGLQAEQALFGAADSYAVAGALDLGALDTSAAGGAAIRFSGGGTVREATEFLNTGGVTLTGGNRFLFAGGLDTGATTLNLGAVAATDSSVMAIGDLLLTGDGELDTTNMGDPRASGAAITLNGGVSGSVGSEVLELFAGTGAVSATAGVANIGSFFVRSSGTLELGAVLTSGNSIRTLTAGDVDLIGELIADVGDVSIISTGGSIIQAPNTLIQATTGNVQLVSFNELGVFDIRAPSAAGTVFLALLQPEDGGRIFRTGDAFGSEPDLRAGNLVAVAAAGEADFGRGDDGFRINAQQQLFAMSGGNAFIRQSNALTIRSLPLLQQNALLEVLDQSSIPRQRELTIDPALLFAVRQSLGVLGTFQRGDDFVQTTDAALAQQSDEEEVLTGLTEDVFIDIALFDFDRERPLCLPEALQGLNAAPCAGQDEESVMTAWFDQLAGELLAAAAGELEALKLAQQRRSISSVQISGGN